MDRSGGGTPGRRRIGSHYRSDLWLSEGRTPGFGLGNALARKKSAERWTRTFDGKVFSSVQSCGSGKDQYLLVERFGFASFAMALVVESDRLFLIPRRWSILGIPMPGFLLPTGSSFEAEKDGRFFFDVEISAPLVGLIVAYRGTLKPEGFA